MSIIYLLIPIAVIFIFIAIGIFIWAVKTHQFDDLERQGSTILFDEEPENKMDSKVNTDDRS